MTSAQSTRPLSNRTRGLHLGRIPLMVLIRLAVLMGASLLLGWATPASADALGAGLTSFLLTMTISGVWGMVDGWRYLLPTGTVVWVATAALYVALNQLPNVLSYPANQGGWTGLPDYLALVGDGFGFMFALVVLPAAVGLILGRLVQFARPSGRR